MTMAGFNEPPYKYNHIAGAATTTVKTGVGILHTISLNTPATGTISIFDNTAGSGTTIAIINATTSVVPTTLDYDVGFNTGLTIVSSASQDITVSYS
jgi:hypothetical protein